MRKTVAQNLVAYSIAAAIVCYAARGVSWRQVVGAGSHATFWIFVIASLGGFLCWFIGETVLYSRLFSYFHGPTGTLELLPTMAAVYFLQIVNSYVASGAFVLFLHARKRVPWIMGGCTLLFQGYLDAMLLAALSLLAIALVPTSPIRLGLNYAAGVLGAGGLIASFWLLWGARLRTGNWLRWLYERPSMASFRMARPSQYIKLLGIRFLIVLAAGFALYGQFVSFHIGVTLMQTLALTPFIVAIGNSPISPGGIGTTQLVFTLVFARFASKDNLFALSLAVSAFNLLIRIPMGLAMGAPLVEEAVEVEGELVTKRKVGQL
ncbi:lysylphosphatidylglycerol synthase domain-containing protein [Candidatus Binatus sp.]|uniref:lysylphosphatidylglycerol synthase domain-containing protein n=1 Tax=Candidatus Binatus sp. TaxID=2811406 RepID=UPI003BCE0154